MSTQRYIFITKTSRYRLEANQLFSICPALECTAH
jgi:hypothetical protein